jgi:hypothetical protein
MEVYEAQASELCRPGTFDKCSEEEIWKREEQLSKRNKRRCEIRYPGRRQAQEGENGERCFRKLLGGGGNRGEQKRKQLPLCMLSR